MVTEQHSRPKKRGDAPPQAPVDEDDPQLRAAVVDFAARLARVSAQLRELRGELERSTGSAS